MKINRLLIVVLCSGLAACDGDRGRTGADGANGADGVAGADGISGVDGADGMDGAGGADGTDGADGQTGAPGRPFTGNVALDVQLFGPAGAVDEKSAVGNGGTDEFTAVVDRTLIEAERRLSL